MTTRPLNHGKRWTPEQHLRLLKLYIIGYPVGAIARHMYRLEESILARFSTLGLADTSDPLQTYGVPLSSSHPKVLSMHDKLTRELNGVHHRGPDDPSGWACENSENDDTEKGNPEKGNPEVLTGAVASKFTVAPITEETTIMFEFKTKHFINGQDVSEMDNATLVKAIRHEQSAIAELEKLDPCPKRIIKDIEERKAKLQEAVEFLDKLDEEQSAES